MSNACQVITPFSKVNARLRVAGCRLPWRWRRFRIFAHEGGSDQRKERPEGARQRNALWSVSFLSLQSKLKKGTAPQKRHPHITVWKTTFLWAVSPPLRFHDGKRAYLLTSRVDWPEKAPRLLFTAKWFSYPKSGSSPNRNSGSKVVTNIFMNI